MVCNHAFANTAWKGIDFSYVLRVCDALEDEWRLACRQKIYRVDLSKALTLARSIDRMLTRFDPSLSGLEDVLDNLKSKTKTDIIASIVLHFKGMRLTLARLEFSQQRAVLSN